MKKYIFMFLLFSCFLYADTPDLPESVKDKRVFNNFKYVEDYLFKNEIGTDAEFFWVEKRNATQVLTTAVATKIEFDLDVDDVFDIFDEQTNYQFQCRKTGLYHFSFSLSIDAATDGSRLSIELRRNGLNDSGNILRGSVDIIGSATGAPRVHGCGYMRLNEGDFVEIFATQSTGVNQNVGVAAGQTYFQGVLVRVD